MQHKLDAMMLKRVQSGCSSGADSDGGSEGASRLAGRPGARRASCVQRTLNAMVNRRSSRHSSGDVDRRSGRSSDGGLDAVSAAEAPGSKSGWASCAAVLKSVRATSASGLGRWSGGPWACGADVASASSGRRGSLAERGATEGELERRNAFGEGGGPTARSSKHLSPSTRRRFSRRRNCIRACDPCVRELYPHASIAGPPSAAPPPIEPCPTSARHLPMWRRPKSAGRSVDRGRRLPGGPPALRQEGKEGCRTRDPARPRPPRAAVARLVRAGKGSCWELRPGGMQARPTGEGEDSAR